MSYVKEMFSKQSIKKFLIKNSVILIFLVISIVGMALSELNNVYIVNELVQRISRNSFLVISLLIPIIAGLGLNFGLVIGAMAGQIAIIIVMYWHGSGFLGFLLCLLVALPIALLFGYLTGRLYNATKGQEMIAGLIVSFFANGLYQFLFLVMAGTVIPMKGSTMLKPDGIGIRNSIALGGLSGKGGLRYALDGPIDHPLAWLLRVNMFIVLAVICAITILYLSYKIYKIKKTCFGREFEGKYKTLRVICTIAILFCVVMIISGSAYNNIKVPILTWFVILLLCLFNRFLMKTKLGQNFKIVGQSKEIARVSGINVNRTRIQAMLFSTVFAAWGQIIFLQNIGTINTYGSHMQVGMFSIAAILIGGATVTNAKISHALIGVILFHIVFIVSPTAGKTIFFGNAVLGEFFRAFIAYGVIGVSLVLHAWKKAKSKQMLKSKL